MPSISHLYFKTAVVFLLVGIAMGLQMAISGSHTVIAAHAHGNLLGWVSMAIFGGYYALNPAKAQTRLAIAQYWVYTVGVVALVPALYMIYSGYPAVEPVAAVSSLVVAVGALMFAYIIFVPETRQAALPEGSLA